MKVAQKSETNPNTRSIHLSHAPSMLNMELSPLFSSVRKMSNIEETPSDVFPLRLQRLALLKDHGCRLEGGE